MSKLLKLIAPAFLLLPLFLLLLGSSSAWGQGIPISFQVIAPTTVVPTGTVPNATYRVCPITSLGTPCSPVANIYSSQTLSPSDQLPNPSTTDQYGNVSVFVAPGYYIEQETVSTSPSIIYSTLVGYSLTGPTSIFGNQPGYNVFANCTGSSAPPTFCPLTAAMIPSTLNATTINGLTVSGTLAVTSTISAAGETLTGALSGTSGSFSGALSGGSLDVSGASTLSTLSVSSTSTLAGLTATSLGINGSQTLTGIQGTAGTNLASASGAFVSGDFLTANATADVVDSGIASISLPFLNTANTFTMTQTAPSFSVPTGGFYLAGTGSFGGGGANQQCLIGGTGIAAFYGSCVPVFTASGTLTNVFFKFVDFLITLSSGTATQTLTGAAVFAESSPYCWGNDMTAANPVSVVPASGSSIVVTGTGSDVVRVVCMTPPGTF